MNGFSIRSIIGFLGFFFSLTVMAQNGAGAFKDISLNEKQITVFGNAEQFSAQSPLGGLGGSFDGNGDYLTISPKPLDGNPTELTIEAWIYMNALPTYGWPIVSQSANVAEGGQQFFVSGSGNGSASRLRFLRGIGAGNSVDLIGATNLPLNEWAHVAVTFDGTNARLFVNGKLDGIVTVNIAWTTTDQPFFVGRTFVANYPQFLSEANGKISDLRVTKNIARYRSSFTPTKLETLASDVNIDPYFSKVAFQLSGNEITGSNSFVDLSSASPKSITTFGDTKQVSDQVKFNPTAITFDGNGDYLVTAASPDFDLDITDWTIEFWIYPRTLGSSPHFLQIGSDRNTNRTTIAYWDGALQVRGRTGATLGALNGLVAGRWQHIAVTKAGNITSAYLDGQLKGSANIAHASGTANTLAIGMQHLPTNLSADYFDGYIDDVRITKGINRYTSVFVPSQIPQLPVLVDDQHWRNVSFLLNCEGKDLSQSFVDSSRLFKAISTVGNVQHTQSEFIRGNSSCFFDGDGDYLSIGAANDFALGSGDFSIELFVRPDSVSDRQGLIFIGDLASNNNRIQVDVINGFLNLYAQNSIADTWTGRASANPLLINQWNHVAVIRKNNSFKIFVNGFLSVQNTHSEKVTTNNQLKIGSARIGNVPVYFKGNIDDLRITRGIARYVENFTPPLKQLEPATFSKDIYSNAVSLSLMSGTYAAGYETISENEIRIFQPIVIGASDTTFENKKIIIDGTNVTISGDHTFESIHIKNGGVLTTPVASSSFTKGVKITANSIKVDAGSSIDISGKGKAADTATPQWTGGSYGGKGGNSDTRVALDTFGSYHSPIDFGLGGHSGGRGGGAIKLKANFLLLDGKILANGMKTSVRDGAGGSGGSIWLDVGNLTSTTGNVEIAANGGAAGVYGAGGGGGRIAIEYETLSGIAQNKIAVTGGLIGTYQTQHGGAGTVYLKNKIGAFSHPFIISGHGSGSTYAPTVVNDLSAEAHIQVNNAVALLKGIIPTVKLDLTNSQVTLADADTLAGDLNTQNSVLNFAGDGIINNTTLDLLNSTINIAGNAQLNRTISLQGGAINVNGDAIFTDSFIGTSAESSSINIGGQLTVPDNNLIVDGITLSLAKDHTFNSIHIKNGGVLTTPVASATLNKAVKIEATTIIVESGSRIDVSGKSKVAEATTPQWTGGSYGGKGGNSDTRIALDTFGSYRSPDDFGRGGHSGGRGGGAIKLTANTLQLDGKILANGMKTSVRDGAGGSGGSIWLDVGNLTSTTGNAEIVANGGAAGVYGAGGGGGRIAIEYETLSGIAQNKITATGGLIGTYQTQHGGPGTVYFKNKTGTTPEFLAINGHGSGSTYAISVVNDINAETHIQVNNGVALLKGIIPTVKLDLTNSQVTLADADTLAGELNAQNSVLNFTGNGIINNTNLGLVNSAINIAGNAQFNRTVSLQGGSINVKGDAIFTDVFAGISGVTSSINIDGQLTVPGNNLVVDGITLSLAKNHTFNSIHIKNGGVLTTPAESTTYTTGITIKATTITVDDGSRIDVTGKGSKADSTAGDYTGGSHGGKGGDYTNGRLAGPTYGEYQEPVSFGRGGRTSGTNDHRGGGAIKLEADTLTLNGKIIADGAIPPSSSHGGGAGGSIWLNVGALTSPSGLGEIRANGSDGRNVAGGGGGRIAIFYEVLSGIAENKITVAGGAGNKSGNAGTLYKQQTEAPPYVYATSLNAISNQPVQEIRVDFSVPIDATSLTIDDVVVTDAGNFAHYPVSITAHSNMSFTFVFAQPLSNGSYKLKVGPNILSVLGNGLDQNRNKIAEGEIDAYLFDFVIDVDMPVAVSVNQAVAPAINKVSSAQFTISGTRENNTSIWLNNAQIVPLGSGDWSHTLTLPQGISNLSVVAKDAATNASPEVRVIVEVDSIAPSVASVSPSANTYLAVAPEFIRINVTENGSGLDAVGSTIVVKQNNVLVSGTTALNAKQFTWTPSGPLVDGEYLVSSQILDLFGNSTAHSYTFVLDRIQPAATVLNEYPPQTSFNNHTFSGSKEAWSQILINGQIIVGANSSTTWSYNKALTAGANRLEFIVRDRAGNQSEPVIVNIAYDNLPPGPVMPLTVVNTGEGQELNLSWSYYDELSNGNDIKNYLVYFNTEPFTHINNAIHIKTVSAGSKSTTITGLTSGNTYYFAVVAVDKSDLHIPEVTSIAGQPLDTRAPEEITNLQIISGLTQLDLRWTPSLDKSGDLESYAISYSDNGEAKTITLSKTDVGAANPIVYSIANLQPATAHNLRISVVDKTGNRSTGVTNSAITLLPNPINVTAEPGVDNAVVSWTPVSAYSLVKQYAIYVDTNPFTSVAAMAPKKIIAKGATNQSLQSTTLTGLVNGTKVYVAVTVINNSNGELKDVIPVAVTPQNDTESPTITSAEYLSSLAPLSLETAPVLVQAGKFAIKATDKSKVSRVVFTLNGEPLGNVLITNAQGAYEQALDLLSLADGDYTLGVKVYDMLENVTEKNYPFSIDLIAPAVPTIVAPVQNITINQTNVQATGKSIAGTEVMIAVNGVDLADITAVDPGGNYSAVIDMVEGLNKIKVKARYIGRTKWSAYSTERSITVNTQMPDAPRGFSATAIKQGQVQLQWSAVTSSNANNQVKGYRVYRSATTFASISDAGVTRLNAAQLITATSYTNTVAVDGNYFYAVLAVNEVGNEGALSNVLSVTADSIGPKITQLTFTPEGEFDAANTIFGRGRVIVNATFSEPLRNAPYFAVVPEAGLPISIDLVKSYGDESVYTGQFQIDQSTASGIAYTTMSAFDNLGNRGTDIQQNNSLKIDTQGPDITQLTIAPVEPLKVDAVSGLHVNVSIRLSEETKAGTSVKLIPMINGSPLAGLDQGISLVAGADNVSFTGEFDLPNTVAQTGSAQLSFAHAAVDELNNASQKIIGQNQFQVYQGNLPPLNTPADLTATALPGGKIKLNWLAVEKAAAYVLYRQGPADTQFIELTSLTALEYEDQTLEDGTYLYAIASVRRENGQESQSSRSSTVSVTADRVAPAKPENVGLELNGAGIVVRWSAPAVDAQGAPQSPQGLTYKLYRTSLPQHAEVTDASVYTPIQTRIPALIALDTKPSEDQHSYFVVAVDAAGNESAPSATDYLNAGLLPVNQLFITLDNNGYPQLSWQHQGRGVELYRVFRKTGDADAELLTPEGIGHNGTNSSYTDNTYNANQVSQGAGQEVVYSVIAVDEHEVESKPHELRLPALSVKLERDKSILLERGVMNQLRFRVDNKGTSAADAVRLYVTLTENGQTREHVSEIFNVAAGANQWVPVVIGGYDKLDAITNLSLHLEQKPQTNQRIRIQQTESVEVGSSSLTLDLNTQHFTRGGSGKVSFNLTNNSDVETELVMATNNSKADSTEVRLILEDLQGNLLTRKTIRQTTGGVINVPSGHTVARVAAKSIFNSEDFSLDIPAAAPDQVRLRLVVDKYHYQLGKENHVEISGMGISKDIHLSDTPYFAIVTDVQPATVNAKNGTVTISGRAVDRTTNEPIANVPVSIVTTVRGFERINTVYSDASGNYVFGYKVDGIAGKYRVSAIHPEMTDRPNHGEFIVEGGSVSPADIDMKVPRNYGQKINLRVRAEQDTYLTNVRLVQIPNAQQAIAELPVGVSVGYSPLANVAANSYKDLALVFTGDNTAADSGLITYRVEADNHTGPNALGTVNISYKLSESAPAVKMTPSVVDTGVAHDGVVHEDIMVTNNGLQPLLNARAKLLGKNSSLLPDWISFTTASNLGNIPVGENLQVQIAIEPKVGVMEGRYEFELIVEGDNLAVSRSIPVFVNVTQSGIGEIAFKISDIYTSTKDTNQQIIEGVNKARIQLQNENVLTINETKNTDPKGEVLFQNMPAGRYTYRVSANDHTSISGRVWIKPGVTSSEKVFLMNTLVSVEWAVREITIEDRYEIKLEAIFKTNVPAPVVVLKPMAVNLPVMKKGDVFQGEFTLTNHGLIRAYNLKEGLPVTNDLVRFEFLKEIPYALEPGQVFTLPYRIQALRDFNPASEATATGGGCGSYGASYTVTYQGKCVNETVVTSQASAHFNSNWGNCVSSGGGASGGGIAGGYIGGVGGGVGYTKGGSAISSEPMWCIADTECDDCNKDNGSAK